MLDSVSLSMNKKHSLTKVNLTTLKITAAVTSSEFVKLCLILRFLSDLGSSGGLIVEGRDTDHNN